MAYGFISCTSDFLICVQKQQTNTLHVCVAA